MGGTTYTNVATVKVGDSDISDKDDVTIECDGFSVYEELTINEILAIEKKLVEIGLIIKP